MKVFFVGAGPGDPDLLTRKAERLLREARVCIYAGSLVSPAIIAMIPDSAEKHDSAGLTFPEVMDLITRARAQDRDVVRLHTGDPTLYSTIGEQIHGLDRLGIAWEIVPGISAFQASAASLGWELTIPEFSQSVVLTRTAGRTPMPASETLENFSRTGASLCLFLSAANLSAHAKTLSDHYGPECPAAVVYHASWPDETIVRGTLADIAEKTLAAGINRTALLIVRKEPEKEIRSRLYAPDFSHGYRMDEG